ncbi:MAG: hypothetical protein LAO78_21360 [Acidobacteriia bacterium]|nr:hypothetical protein [Terriglobia bacterium]
MKLTLRISRHSSLICSIPGCDRNVAAQAFPGPFPGISILYRLLKIKLQLVVEFVVNLAPAEDGM